ncbi:MAG: TIR domain-containing protein [Bacteroidia bacterium]
MECLTVEYSTFESTVKQLIMDGDKLIGQSIRSQEDYEALKNKEQSWTQQCVQLLKSSFDKENNQFTNEFKMYSKTQIIRGRHGEHYAELSKQLKNKIIEKKSYLDSNLHFIKVADLIRNPQDPDLSDRNNLTIEEKEGLLLSKLYDLYDNGASGFYPVKALLESNGVTLKHADEDRELVKALKSYGYVDDLGGMSILAKITSEGAKCIERYRKEEKEKKEIEQQKAKVLSSQQFKIYNSILDNINSRPLSETFIDIIKFTKSKENIDLQRWVKLEANGYIDTNSAFRGDDVPDYRKVAGQYCDTYGRPLTFEDPALEFFNHYPIRNAIVELEEYAKAKSLVQLKDMKYINYINNKFNVDVVTYEFDPKQIFGILNAIKSEVLERFDGYTISENEGTSPQIVSNPNGKGKIFISHSVIDKEIVQEFTENVLQLGLGIKVDDEVFNISIEDAGIKTSEDFKKRIESELKYAKTVILFITENYKKSEACMNEMGASWILGIPVIPFILEPVYYNTVGFIHNPTQQLKLNSKDDLKSFVAEYKGKLFSSEYNDKKLDRKIDDFLNFLNSEMQNALKSKSATNDDSVNEEQVNNFSGVVFPAPLTLEEKLKLLKEENDYKIAVKTYFNNSAKVIEDYNSETQKIYLKVKELLSKLIDAVTEFYCSEHPHEFITIVEIKTKYALHFKWSNLHRLNNEDALILECGIYNAENYNSAIFPGNLILSPIMPASYSFHLNKSGEIGWLRTANDNDFNTSEELVKSWGHQYLNKLVF